MQNKKYHAPPPIKRGFGGKRKDMNLKLSKMKTRKGFIVKSTLNGKILFSHLTSQELHFISKICSDSDNNEVEVKEVYFKTIDEFIVMRF